MVFLLKKKSNYRIFGGRRPMRKLKHRWRNPVWWDAIELLQI
jgi:hypothetical protein